MKLFSTKSVITVLLLVFMIAGFTQAQMFTTKLDGYVTADSLPVPGYKLLLSFKGDTVGFKVLLETDANGYFFHQVFKNQTYTITSLDTFMYNPVSVDVVVGNDPVTQNIDLTMRSDLLDVTGSVMFDGAGVETMVYFMKLPDDTDLGDFRDYETHFNVPHIAMKWASYSAASDASGNFALKMIAGKYVVYVEAGQGNGMNYLAHWGVFELTGPMQLEPIILKEMKTLSGNVKNADQYDYVEVLAHSLNAGRPMVDRELDANGDYMLDVAPGTYIVRVRAFFDNYMYMVYYDSVYQVSKATHVEVQDDVTGIDFVLPPAEVYPFSINGTVTSKQSGLPLEGAGVSFVSYNFATNLWKTYDGTTDANGDYHVEGWTILQEDSLVGFAWKDTTFFAQFYNGKTTYMNADPIIYHANEDVMGIDFALDSIDTENGYGISGWIFDEEGNPVKQGVVEAYTTATSVGIISVQIDTNGYYEFDPVFPSGSTVFLQAWGGYNYIPIIYKNATSWQDTDNIEALEITDHNLTDINFVVPEKAPARHPLAEIRGKLKLMLGGNQLAKAATTSPYDGAVVYVKPQGTEGWTDYDYVDENGNFTLHVEQDGQYDMLVTTRDNGDFEESVSVNDLSASVEVTPTGISDRDDLAVVRGATLHNAYPNPFNPTTTIKVDVAKAGKMSLVIYNVLGQKVKTLFKGNLTSGANIFTWNGTDDLGKQVATGLYFYQLKAKNTVQTKAVMFLK